MNEYKVLPAYAGMIPGRGMSAGIKTRAPRIRGDDPPQTIYLGTPPRCSPHTRG